MKGAGSPDAAAEYLDVRVDALSCLVKTGRVPAPEYQLGPRTPRYDRLKLDEAMGSSPMEGTRDPDKALELWRSKNAAKKALKGNGCLNLAS